MQYTIKFFPEIIIKSKPVRKQFASQLRGNIRKLLKEIDPDVEVIRDWDKITVRSQQNDAESRAAFISVLQNTPGIGSFLDVVEYPFEDMHTLYEQCHALHAHRLAGKRFAVRCKRVGKHEFKSGDIERYIGGGLNQNSDAAGVELKKPDITVRIELVHDTAYIVNEHHQGLGGFPLGSLDSVMSLISGGFDSPVASYLTMKRGLRTHFVFFNMGGREHEVGVKEVALYLWLKYGASHRVKFVSVPFEGVVAELLRNVDNPYMGVIFKRMMIRAASVMAENLGVEALVTGEAIAQVSSQTLANLSVIDEVSETLVLRPLIASDKEDIINIARKIGTEDFAANMPEYCGVISVNPKTRAKLERVKAEEARFDFSILEKAIEDAVSTNIDQLGHEEYEQAVVESLPIPLAEAIIIDVRHPDEAEQKPLNLNRNQVEAIPFYELHSRFAALDQNKTYQLYCDKGVMSRLHASHLVDSGFQNVKVYRPS